MESDTHFGIFAAQMCSTACPDLAWTSHRNVDIVTKTSPS